MPWTQEGLAMHIPHPLAVPIALDTEGDVDPLPRLRLGIACEWRPAIRPKHPCLLEVRTQPQADSGSHRRAWLAEIASLVTEWVEAGTRLLVHTLPFEDRVFAQRITRHALLGVQSLQGAVIWAHPSAAAAGLLPFECPPTQIYKELGRRARWRMEAIRPLDPLDPVTGLPTWHLALSDCLRAQHLSPQVHAAKILEERARILCQTDRSPDLLSARQAALRQVEEALRAILGFEGLLGLSSASERRVSDCPSQI
jgi:hypothetical protein